MNKKIYTSIVIIILLCFSSCEKDEIITSNQFNTTLSFQDNSLQHIKNETYQSVIDSYIKKGIIGTSIYVKDNEGIWIGTGGKADISSNIDVDKGNQFMIASITKVFTATVIFSLVDKGILSIDDPISEWIPSSITKNIDNTNEATIANLLSHKSGIVDYYTTKFEMARYNTKYNNWVQEDILKYVYGKNANFPVGEKYSYSNTNFLLLGMIIENATNMTLKEAYDEMIFLPLGLNNAYYDTGKNAAPTSLISGYYNLYGNGYILSDFLYKDELSTGDGGIIINPQDLGEFLDELMQGNLLRPASLMKMQDWFDIEGDGKNGFGLEYFENEYGISYGHSGGADGFTSVAHYYPNEDITVIILLNFTPSNDLFDVTLNFISDITDVAFN
ncbi:serine hydrolase domain-containing protein [Aquimarina sp. 2-A2]|uniref:serine hydrolase domain-containing protein n=1 Tax=Aquimarina sp. 2-A2 TaxID=3382644 RepID=UPI00387F0AFC